MGVRTAVRNYESTLSNYVLDSGKYKTHSRLQQRL